jgi:hypothetical protein
VPDSHAAPDKDNRRFEWLGRLILDRQPDVIVNLGDLFDMNSLCSYDRNKKSFEGRRYKKDIAVGVDALEKMHGPFNRYNEQRRNTKKAKLKEPRKIITLGNHSFRLIRAVENSPELEGLISVDNLRLEEFGYDVIPYKKPICIEGVWFCHYWASGVKGEAVSGFNIAANILAKNSVSSVCGHSHLFDLAIRSRPDGTKLIGLNAGCYLEESTYDDATLSLWWKGVTMLHDVDNGSFDIEQISIERIQSLYG